MLSFLLSFVASDRFAVLAAGSDDWFNYRHQADIFTLYDKLMKRGYKAENIVMLAYDDIALDPANPFQGQIFHDIEHKYNVYPGADKINYRKDDCNAKTFKHVLTTELKSTTSDDLFIYYDDHGAYGFVCFPTGPDLYGDVLSEALLKMEANGKYGRCLFGIEACYAGSVAEWFKNNNMVTITAANSKESSYADIYDVTLDNYLSNEFTNAWFKTMDMDPKMTLGEFFEEVKTKTTQSHVCFFGDQKMNDLTIDIFFGAPKQPVSSAKEMNTIKVKPMTATYGTLVKLMKHKNASVRARARLTLHELESLSKKMNTVIGSLIEIIDPENHDYYMNAVNEHVTPEYLRVARHFNDKFGKRNNDDMSKYMVLANLVDKNGPIKVIEAINKVL